jgi:hypothetical protein
MLAQILAVLVGTGSVGLYIAAFFFPEIHRKQDFIWSGVGFFYALSLWIYARQTTGGILIGETASVALLGWFVWQTIKLRRQLVPTNQQTPIPSTSQIKQQLGLKQTGTKTAKSNPATAPEQAKPSTPATPVTPPPATVVPAPVVTQTVRPTTPVEVATSTVVREQRQQPTTTPVPPIPPVIPPTQPVPVTRAQPQQQQSPAVPTVPASVVPPVARAVIPVPVDVPKQPQPPTVPPAQAEDSEAWIKLEVKPSPVPAKPLGQAVKPPTTAPTQLPAIAAESVTRNVPTEPEISGKLDDAQM